MPAGDATSRSGSSHSLVGPYRVGKPIGMGSMANVVEAVHAETGERVALKILNSDLAARSDIVSRFIREGRALQRLRHPNIVRVIDHGVGPGGEAWIAMEHLHAVTLDALILRGGIHPARGVKIAMDIASALAAVHGAGIVHRDVKPENILVVDPATSVESGKLIDFGIAKMTKAEMGENSVAHTRVGSVLGSTAFASPEQLAGEPVDARADVFALAVSLYEALTGELPFDGNTVKEQIEARKAGAIVPLHRRQVKGTVFPATLEDFIARALSRDPERRPKDGGAALGDLTSILAEVGPAPTPSGPPSSWGMMTASSVPPSSVMVASSGPPSSTARASTARVASSAPPSAPRIVSSIPAARAHPSAGPTLATPSPSPVSRKIAFVVLVIALALACALAADLAYRAFG